MGDTNVQECKCCREEWDCINGLCEMCSDYNYKLQKQSDLLTLGLLQEKQTVVKLQVEIEKLRQVILLAPGENEADFRYKYNKWWDTYYREIRTPGCNLLSIEQVLKGGEE